MGDVSLNHTSLLYVHCILMVSQFPNRLFETTLYSAKRVWSGFGIAFCAPLSSWFLCAHHCWANFKISGTRFHNWTFRNKIPPVTFLVTAIPSMDLTNYKWWSQNVEELQPRFPNPYFFRHARKVACSSPPVKSVWPRIGEGLPLPASRICVGSNWMALSQLLAYNGFLL